MKRFDIEGKNQLIDKTKERESKKYTKAKHTKRYTFQERFQL